MRQLLVPKLVHPHHGTTAQVVVELELVQFVIELRRFELRRREIVGWWLERLVVIVALILAVTPLEASTARLTQRLERELAAKQVELVTVNEPVVVRFTEAGHSNVDASWRILGAVAHESRQAPGVSLRVEVVGADVSTCLRREQGAADYLFGKQHVEPYRVTLTPCVVPQSATLGALTLEARRQTIGEYSNISAVNFVVSNTSEQAVKLELVRLELVPSPRAVKPATARTFTIPAHAKEQPLEVRFAEVKDPRAWSIRLTLKTSEGEATIASPVVRLGFYEGDVEGR